jgi:hypothetical protein
VLSDGSFTGNRHPCTAIPPNSRVRYRLQIRFHAADWRRPERSHHGSGREWPQLRRLVAVIAALQPVQQGKDATGDGETVDPIASVNPRKFGITNDTHWRVGVRSRVAFTRAALGLLAHPNSTSLRDIAADVATGGRSDQLSVGGPDSTC